MPDRSAQRTGAWLALAALAAAGLLWMFWAQAEPAPATRRDAANRADSSSPEQTRLVADGTTGPGEQRTAVAATPPTGTSGETLFLRIRLRGLHPDAPWTAKLRLDLDGRDEGKDEWLEHAAAASPRADGTCTFELPPWVATATQQKGRIEADDPLYLPIARRWEGTLDLASELVLDVQVVAVLEGRVVTTRGEPVAAARVSAFAIRDGVIGEQLGEATTGDDGLYRQKVPPGTPLLLLATPMETKRTMRVHIPSGSVRTDRTASGMLRDDLLPAATNAHGSVGKVTAVPDLILPDASHVQGTVRWEDGRPVANATVWIHARDGEPIAISEYGSVRPTSTGGFAPGTNATTDEAGRFRLPAQAGVSCRLMVARLDGVEIVGDHITAEAVAPQDIEFRVPLPLRLRTLRDGTPVPNATIEVEVDWPTNATGRLRLDSLSTDTNGEVHIVTTQTTVHVRATSGSLQSAWTNVTTTPARTVDLQLATALGELAIEFEGEFPVRNAHFAWTRDGGGEGRQSLVRDDSSGPFRLHLEPGRYRLRMAAAGGERNGLFLLPVERAVEVTMVPQSLTLPARFGGRFTVHATDRAGLYVAGTCRVLDANGTDRTERFARLHSDQSATAGTAGELLADGPNDYCGLLPAGEYLLEFDFPEHGAQQRRVTIKTREISDVRIRLP